MPESPEKLRNAPAAAGNAMAGPVLIFRLWLRRAVFTPLILLPLIVVLLGPVVLGILKGYKKTEPVPYEEEDWYKEVGTSAREMPQTGTEEEKREFARIMYEQARFKAKAGSESRPVYIFLNTISVYNGLLLILFSLFYGLSIVTTDVNRKTVTYLFTRPVPRWAQFAAKFVAAWVLVVCLLGGGIVLCSIMLYPHIKISHLGYTLFVLGTSAVAYLAFFAALGAIFRRSMVIALIWALLIEIFLSGFLSFTTLGRFTISYYSSAFTMNMTEVFFGERMPHFIEFTHYPGPWLAAISAGLLALAVLVYSRKEYFGK